MWASEKWPRATKLWVLHPKGNHFFQNFASHGLDVTVTIAIEFVINVTISFCVCHYFEAISIVGFTITARVYIYAIASSQHMLHTQRHPEDAPLDISVCATCVVIVCKMCCYDSISIVNTLPQTCNPRVSDNRYKHPDLWSWQWIEKEADFYKLNIKLDIPFSLSAGSSSAFWENCPTSFFISRFKYKVHSTCISIKGKYICHNGNKHINWLNKCEIFLWQIKI